VTRLGIILIALHFVTGEVNAQTRNATDREAGRMDQFYLRNSPLDYLMFLKADFKNKDKINIFVVDAPSPKNWIRLDHIPALIKLIYSKDSTKSIMNPLSSHLTSKSSSIGNEAQNLIECFRKNESYPNFLNSYGQPDKIKAMEIEIWWKKYKSDNK
jgi:hypothetical protein